MRDDVGQIVREARPQKPVKRVFGMFNAQSNQLRTAFERITSVVPVEDFKHPAPELKSIFLCMTPRSGSSYLGSALDMNKVARFGEHFRVVGGTLEKAVKESGAKSFEDYVLARIATFRVKDVFGAKADWLQFAPLYHFGAYERYFRNASYIYLTREDVLAQAISRYIATETGYFHSVNKHLEDTKSVEVEFDFDKLWRHAEHLIEMQSAWERFFATEGISPLRLTYEEVEADPADVLRRISDFVGVALPDPIVVDTDYKKVRNERHEKMKTRAVEEAHRRRLAQTPPRPAPAAHGVGKD